MNNVINLKSRQRVQYVRYRFWAYSAAGGTVGAACGYWTLASLWPEVFLHWLAGLLITAAVLTSTTVAAGFYALGVQERRERERRVREWREKRAAQRRAVRDAEKARLRAIMEAPTEVIQILAPRPAAYVAMEDRMRLHLMSDLTERTGDLGVVDPSSWASPPRGWRTGAA